jgi:hypothetical protein
LEDAGCVGLTLASIVIILLYVDDIVLMAKIPYGLDKQLITLEDLFSSMSMILNTDKKKVMIIKSKMMTYNTLVYDNNSLEEVPSFDIHHKLNWNYSIEKMINEGWKAYCGLENNCKSTDLWLWDKGFHTLVTLVILYEL